MNEWTLLHEVLLKTQVVYPLIAGILVFSLFEIIVEWKERREMQKYLLSISEAVEYTGIGRNRMYALVRSGTLKTIKVGRYNKIHRLELEKFLDEAADERMTI